MILSISFLVQTLPLQNHFFFDVHSTQQSHGEEKFRWDGENPLDPTGLVKFVNKTIQNRFLSVQVYQRKFGYLVRDKNSTFNNNHPSWRSYWIQLYGFLSFILYTDFRIYAPDVPLWLNNLLFFQIKKQQRVALLDKQIVCYVFLDDSHE